MGMEIRPITLRAAQDYIKENHRHNRSPRGCKWCLSVWDGDRMCGVAVAGRPVARGLDDGRTVEITRVCTDGTRNACSILYGACVRVAREMGYTRVITYTLEEEPGTSVKASGFLDCGPTGGGTWDCKARPREKDHTPHQLKRRWERRIR